MAIISTENHWAFAFGLLGNIISFIVFLAPVPTFIRIWKKKSTEGFDSLPYVVALFSATLWLYYATQKDNVFLLVTINSFGCFIETIYIAIFIAFAHKQARCLTLKFLLALNFGGFCLILLLCQLLAKGQNRAKVIGGICVGFSVSVFAAPLSIIRVVIKTKSVEFMPFNLSLFLTISAVAWLLYGVSLKDFYIAFPNVFGFLLGLIQMALFLVYKYCIKAPVLAEKEPANKLPEHGIDMPKLSSVTAPEPAVSSVAQTPATFACDDRTVGIEDAKNGTEFAADAKV